MKASDAHRGRHCTRRDAVLSTAIGIGAAFGLVGPFQIHGRSNILPGGTGLPTEGGMEKVTGIGGFFFRARDPKALARWYRDHLGVALVPQSYDELPWRQEAGPTAFGPFPQDTDYFGRAEQAWSINFRVRNLAAMVAQLEAAGIKVTVDPKEYPNGRFARVYDPEGNPIELWEPTG